MLYRFGDHELDEEAFTLRRAGAPIALQPKVLRLLLHLVRNRDRVVPKEELLATVWSDAAVTVSSLTRAVSLARQAVGDSGATTLVNVPRRGYRFGAVVEATPRGVGGAPPAARYVGRGRILARLEATLDAALAGSGRILLLVGEAGIGKTRTAELLAERARARAALVAAAYGPQASEASYRPWSGILAALAAADPWALEGLPIALRTALGRLLPHAHDAARGARPDGAAARSANVEALRAFLTRVCDSRPLALFLDDLHAADTASFQLLEALGPALAGLPVAIVATCREEDVGGSALRVRALERLLRSTALDRWPLRGLARDEICEFVTLSLDRPPDAALVAALGRQTSGNPLLLRESLRSLEARDLLGAPRAEAEWEALLPTGIRHLLAPKLRQLGAGALEVLACAAACGRDVERALLERCLEGGAGLAARLRETETAGLLSAGADGRRLHFPHVLVREAVYAELLPPGDERRAMHARIALALETADEFSDDALAALAHHACEAAPRVAPLRAAVLAEASADRARRALDFDAAAAWCERSLGMLDRAPDADPAASARVLLALGAAQTQAHGVERARFTYREAAERARATGRGDLFAQAALGFAHRPNASGHGDPDVIELLEEALPGVPETDAALAIRVRSRLAAELRYADLARSSAMIESALAAARQLADPAVLAQVLDDCSFVRSSRLDPEGWVVLNAEIVRAARAARDLELELLGQKGRVTGFLELGDVAAVDREARGLERTAAALRTPYARWLSAALRAMRALLDGDLALAERHIEATREPGEQLESPDVAIEIQAQIVYLRLEQGRVAEIEAVARQLVRGFPDVPAWRAALARMLLARDRRAEAGEELGRLAHRGFGDGPRDRGWLPTLAMAAEVAFAVGDARSAEALVVALTPHARLAVVAGSGLLYYGSVAHHLGLVLAAGAHWDAALVQLEAALAAEERAGARLWEARTRLAWAQVLLARNAPGDRARAAQLATETETTASDLGWAALEAEAHPLASVSWAGPSPPRSGAPGRRRGRPQR